MISIIMSVYNVEKYLDECLKSIFNQTYKNFELIIVNDGSTDNSKLIIDKYRNENSNIIYIEQENKGISEARNLALSISKGEYILYIDSDDYIDKDMLKLMIEKIELDKSDMVIIGHEEFYDEFKNKNINISLNVDENKIYSGTDVANMMLDLKIMGVLWNKLYKRSQLEKEKFYFEPGRYTQDWYPVFKHVFNLDKISFVNKPLYKYRIRNSSITGKKTKKRLDDYIYAVESIINYAENNKENLNKNNLEFFKLATFENIISINNSINTANNKEIKEYKSNNNISIKNSFKINNFNINSKIKLLLWKLNIYGISIKLKKQY